MPAQQPFEFVEKRRGPVDPYMVLIFEDKNGPARYSQTVAHMVIETGLSPGIKSDAQSAENRLKASFHAYNDLLGVITGFGAKDTTDGPQPRFSAEAFIRTAVRLDIPVALLTRPEDPDPADYIDTSARDIALPLTPLLSIAAGPSTAEEHMKSTADLYGWLFRLANPPHHN